MEMVSVLRTLRSGMTLINVRPPFPGRKVWRGDRHWPPCPFRAANNIPRIVALRLNGRNQCSDHDRKYVRSTEYSMKVLISRPCFPFRGPQSGAGRGVERSYWQSAGEPCGRVAQPYPSAGPMGRTGSMQGKRPSSARRSHQMNG
jgi:hypothetical protein